MQKYLFQLNLWLYKLLRGAFMSSRQLLLSTTGRQTGQIQTNVLFYLRDGNSFVVFASNSGMETDPDWYLNLTANPKVVVQIGATQFVAQAETVPDAQRQRLVDKFVAANRINANDQNNMSRTMPIVQLTPITNS